MKCTMSGKSKEMAQGMRGDLPHRPKGRDGRAGFGNIRALETKADARAELVIREPIGKTREAAVAALDNGQ